MLLPLLEKKAARLKDRVGQTVQLGIRPEDFGVRETHGAEGDPACFIPGRIKLVEHMGSELYMYFDVNGNEFTSRIRLEGLGKTAAKARGEENDFYFIMDRCHIFDKETGINLTLD